jgi:hypothetical protein
LKEEALERKDEGIEMEMETEFDVKKSGKK